MNIVLYTTSFLPSIGGREIVVYYLAEALTRLGHEVRVFGPAGFRSQRKARFAYSVHRWPTLLGGLFANQEQVLKLFIDTAVWGCDVVHAHSTYPCGFAVAQLKSIRNLPFVLTPHGQDINTIPEIGFGLRLDPALRPKIQYALQKAELVTSISDTVEASLLDAGAMPEKIRKIPNGIDFERFQQANLPDVFRWLRVEPGSRLILTVGNYHPRKGHDILIRSMPFILAREPRVRLIIVGGGTAALRPLIEELQLQDKVRLTGRIDFPITDRINGRPQSRPGSEDWLAAVYQNSELYISAGISEGAEGLSLALLDAMAAGLPVVATDISGNRDLICDGETGYLVSPGDPTLLAASVLPLLSEGELRSEMGKACRKTADNYRWTKIAQQYLDVYQEAREQTRARAHK